MTKNLSLIILLTFAAAAGSGCNKFLDAKPNKRLVVPETLKDLQAVLDNVSVRNGSEAMAGEASADNYFFTTEDWASLSRDADRRLYLWEKDHLFEVADNEWLNNGYKMVYRANIVLDQIDDVSITSPNRSEWEDVKGQALFMRAAAFFSVAQIWAPAYDAATAAKDLGIPLRLKADFTEISVRSTVKETYDRIQDDLKLAARLLPIEPVHVVRPSKSAAYALLARTYMSMRQYDKMLAYADSSLRLYNTLLDYNTVNTAAAKPFQGFISEIVYHAYTNNNLYYMDINNRVDSTLYQSYVANDLRKAAFFRNNNDGTYAFKGSYQNSGSGLFFGIATDEIYLMRAEGYARQGRITEAMSDLNTLMVNRWKTGSFIPFSASTKEEALQLVLQERRKELLMRGLRWTDIKRLNKDGAGITLKRLINGQTYTLPPNDPRYALPIPEDIIDISGMQQNPR